MNVKRSPKAIGLAALTLVGVGLHTMAMAATRVYLNGQPLATSVAPIQRSNRTLVPMRDIFEALGATVVWDGSAQGITAQRGADRIWLQIGNRAATVNGERVMLDQPAMLYRNSTMVPLRFVSESLGAQVQWHEARRLVSINTANGNTLSGNIVSGNTANAARYGSRYNSGQAVAGVRTISVPVGAVVPVTLDTEISSATARRGETFTATVVSERLGDSEFPAGSRVEGVIREARPKTGSNPGILDLDFRAVILPGGQRVPIRGELIALDDDSVTTSQGRIMAKNRSDNKDRLKIIGIGAAAGFVLGKILDKNSTVTAVLGAAGGYLYSRHRDKNKVREAVVPEGAKIGVRLNSTATYADADYASHRTRYFKM